MFSVEIINVPRYGKVKMPTVDLYDGTTDPEEHLGMYKAQMYVRMRTTQHTVDTSLLS